MLLQLGALPRTLLKEVPQTPSWLGRETSLAPHSSMPSTSQLESDRSSALAPNVTQNAHSAHNRLQPQSTSGNSALA